MWGARELPSLGSTCVVAKVFSQKLHDRGDNYLDMRRCFLVRSQRLIRSIENLVGAGARKPCSEVCRNNYA